MGVSSKHSPSRPVAMEKDLVPHPIMRAALEGNLRVLKEMATVVKNGSGIWNRALMLAAMKGGWTSAGCSSRMSASTSTNPTGIVVQFLLSEPDVRALVSGNTAVFISAMLGTAATTRYLLDCGADPTVAGSMGSALHGAVMNGQYETIELLLSRGIDVDLFDSVHGTALHVAASKGEAGMVKLLLEHHAVFKHPLELEAKIAKVKSEATEAFRRKEYMRAAELYNYDYGKACKAFEDGLKLDRTNVDIKNALREAQEALKSADCAENNELFGVN
ncbi:hypothetical protein ACQ4PT_038077 [Festuca glaucescens]